MVGDNFSISKRFRTQKNKKQKKIILAALKENSKLSTLGFSPKYLCSYLPLLSFPFSNTVLKPLLNTNYTEPAAQNI